MTTSPAVRAELVSELRRILDGDGALPPERALSERLGVNRYQLRAALQQMRASGEAPPGKPRRAPGPASAPDKVLRDTSPPELWELRLSMEPAIARLAALRATPDQVAALSRIHAAADPDRFELEQDIAFHRAVAEASGNSLFAWLVDAIAGFTRDDAFRMQLPAFTEETGWRHHDAILSAIQRRSPAEAEAAMREHHEAIHRWLSGFPG